MIFNEELLFIHIGKTGGMSCAEYLLNTLKPPIFNCSEDARREQRTLRPENVVPVPQVHRHVTLSEALSFVQAFKGKTLEDFRRVVVVIRHPYSLEYSFYNHLKKPEVRKRRSRDKRLLELADGDFKTFVSEAEYHRRGMPQEAFFLVRGEIPDCVYFVRFEEIGTAFPSAVSDFVERSYSFPHRSRTEYTSSLRSVLDEETRELLYRKHRFMFDNGFYSR